QAPFIPLKAYGALLHTPQPPLERRSSIPISLNTTHTRTHTHTHTQTQTRTHTPIHAHTHTRADDESYISALWLQNIYIDNRETTPPTLSLHTHTHTHT